MEEIREKLLCVLRNNMDKVRLFQQDYYIEAGDFTIKLFSKYVYKDIFKEREVVIKPKYFWQKSKIEKRSEAGYELDYFTWVICYSDYITTLTKEEYEELSKLKEEKTQEKILNNLNKLCK
jgi:hypothetical protein